MTARSRNGEAMASTDETTMIAVTPAIGQRWGTKSRPMRRRDTPRAWLFSAGVTERPRMRGAVLDSKETPLDGGQFRGYLIMR